MNYYSRIDCMLQKNWKYAAKKVLEKMCCHELNRLHIGNCLGRLLVGDAENIFACSIAFSFGNPQYGSPLNHKHSIANKMVDISGLDSIEEQCLLYDMFYSKNPIELMKNRYGRHGDIIVPRSILDAVNKVGLVAEELLIEIDLAQGL